MTAVGWRMCGAPARWTAPRDDGDDSTGHGTRIDAGCAPTARMPGMNGRTSARISCPAWGRHAGGLSL
ncbi:hypothetical protein RAA17_18525 [Komagataeibacter rhaeticus]|nr:hypothetical protein [Komagataeibacter rhaeticus]